VFHALDPAPALNGCPVSCNQGDAWYKRPEMKLPPCGLYRTTRAIGAVPEGRLVFFHNHGNPGPGLYQPTGWRGNRARFAGQGTLLPEPTDASALEALEAEGLYRVREPFFCCEKKCRRFEAESLVQLGYDGAGQAILFVPEIVDGLVTLPERGTRIDREAVASLAALQVPVIHTEPGTGTETVH
jgi:hypothetical protein